VSIDLFQLLPAVYRLRDAQLAQSLTLLTPAEHADLNALQTQTTPLTADQQAQLAELSAKAARGPLQSLLMLIGEQIAAVAYDLDQLYDDQFIETCADWVIPYIGDLIGYQSVKGIAPAVDNPRAEVAETISLRRRKGTVLVLEQLARDVTGWSAHAVEFFRVLADTQYMNHIRHDNHYAPDLRRWQPGLYIDTGFDRTAHKVDVRRIAPRRGRYNIQNIGIFLWSLGAYSITRAAATAAATNTATGQFCYRFSSLGMDIPLFHRAVSQGEEITAPAQPVNVVDRLRRRVLCEDLKRGVGAAYYGPGNSLVLSLGGEPVNPYQIQIANLSGDDGSWANLPTTDDYAAVVDPELGRIALPPTSVAATTLTVSYYYGFNGDMGGGEYARSDGADGFKVTDPAWVVPFPDPRFPTRTLQDALNYAISQFSLTGAVAVEIAVGSGTLSAQDLTHSPTGALSVDLPAEKLLELRAADTTRPTLIIKDSLSVSGDANSTFILNGFVIAADATMTPVSLPTGPAALVHVPKLRTGGTTNLLGQLDVTHCTLVPGWSVGPTGNPLQGAAPSLIVEPAGVTVVGTRSILGGIRAAPFATVNLTDCIVDATDPTLAAYADPDNASGGAALTLEGCTIVGKVHADLLALVSDSIFWSALASGDKAPWLSGLVADRKQQGCVRFSFLPYKAITPRRFKCVEQAIASPMPLFFSRRYGNPAYMKLLVSTDDSIRRGAQDCGEMGCFNFLLAPQRESDLNIRLQEYAPVGLEFGLIYQN
jgi:hypothetical protein